MMNRKSGSGILYQVSMTHGNPIMIGIMHQETGEKTIYTPEKKEIIVASRESDRRIRFL